MTILARIKRLVLSGPNLQGICLYTKGKFVEADGIETYYFFISAKCAE